MGKDAKPATTTTTSTPWAPTQPYLKEILGTASDLYQANPSPEFFPGQTYAQSPHTTGAVQDMAARAQQPGGLTQQAQSTTSGLMTPDFSGITDAVKAQVMPSVNAQFQSAGRAGSGLHAEAMGTGMARGLAPFQLQANQQAMQAAQMAPQMQNADLMQRYQVGLMDENLQQRQINEDMARYDYNQNSPWNALNRYSGIVQGQAGLGGTKTSTETAAQPSTLQQLAGLGFGIGGLFF